ncbi:MAG: hypothetical protein GW748_01410 [Alphaproteobacteria bacterium]|nr:hypothetical protein [Alphaproteobacteria bacterium]NCQ66392.1 hypothetical protein [Alphaproteobacteria bacterium]NCT06877.1 hypothetical protein [Alphaproteobacteria bacterium]
MSPPRKRGVRTNLIAAKRSKELLAPVFIRGSTSAAWFNQWFEEHLLKELNLHATVLTDNAAFHKKEEIRALAEKKDARFCSHRPILGNLIPLNKILP